MGKVGSTGEAAAAWAAAAWAAGDAALAHAVMSRRTRFSVPWGGTVSVNAAGAQVVDQRVEALGGDTLPKKRQLTARHGALPQIGDALDLFEGELAVGGRAARPARRGVSSACSSSS